ncbi:MAG: glycosyltransferase [Paraglaciecola sp.]|nr:glycosyltransferase [Paraglaciecola sp.]
MAKPALLLFTSLYPYPWQPSRATFNFQQYQSLRDYYDINYLVPVPWWSWFIHLFSIIRQKNYPNVIYFPMFYIPGMLRNSNSYFLLFSVLICILPFIKLIKAKRVLASWAYPDAIVCAWLKPLVKYRLFIQCLGSDVNIHQHYPKRRALLSAAFKRADAVISVSKDLTQKVLQVSSLAKAITIYNGVNLDRFNLQRHKPKAKSIIFIGNLIRTKGIYELLEAIKLLNDPEIKLDIVGGGPEANALKNKATKLGIAHQLNFYGRLNHNAVAELMQKNQLLVLPSYSEGVPNVIMEALACGIPVVATAVGGIPEVVTKHSGVLLEDYNPATIAAGILNAWKLNWQPSEIRKSIAQFTWQANSLQVFNVIECGVNQFISKQRPSNLND